MSAKYCIGCGCDEAHACVSDPDQGPCWWMRFNHGSNTGVCSYCEDLLRHWDGGGRALLPKLISERFVRQPLSVYQDKATATRWMDAPLEALGGRSPRQAILAGELDQVHQLLDELRRTVIA